MSDNPMEEGFRVTRHVARVLVNQGRQAALNTAREEWDGLDQVDREHYADVCGSEPGQYMPGELVWQAEGWLATGSPLNEPGDR